MHPNRHQNLHPWTFDPSDVTSNSWTWDTPEFGVVCPIRVILNFKLIDGDKPQIPNWGGQEREGISSDRDFLSLEQRGADKVHCAFLSSFLYHHFCSQGQNLERGFLLLRSCMTSGIPSLGRNTGTGMAADNSLRSTGSNKLVLYSFWPFMQKKSIVN